eukprot:TRINITY_DN3777_c0_g1_i1.p1 TRINITY_DN3777_c0_g1~~TRINITY_DN3777_c0_g1_i1.p1  ORF type:complete len:113 (+),score=47.38 TRINITY_DN3777_c0_g1_i1:45-341(+)
MSEPSKVHGTKDQVVGAIKETTGNLVGNKSLEAEGTAQRAQGTAEIEAKKLENRMEGYGEQVKGTAKEIGGKIIGDKQTEYEGKAEKAKGEVRVNANQ